MLAIQPLAHFSRCTLVGNAVGNLGSSHNKPAAKTADIVSFRRVGICSCHMRPRGKSSIEKSETTFTAAVVTKAMLTLTQRPGIVGSHIFALGTH